MSPEKRIMIFFNNSTIFENRTTLNSFPKFLNLGLSRVDRSSFLARIPVMFESLATFVRHLLKDRSVKSFEVSDLSTDVSSMLISKFSVPVTRYTSLNNLKNVPVRFASKSSCSDNVKRSCKPKEKIDGRIIRSRCEEYKTAIAKCPKTSCNTVSQIPRPKCNLKISDTYLYSLKLVEEYAKKITKLINESTETILHDLEAGIKQKKAEEFLKREEILKSVDTKIWELINLDDICGIKKKWKILMINDKVVQDLKFWQCDDFPEVKTLRSEIEKFKKETKCQLDSAIALLKNCRKCDSPFSLKDCVEKNTEVALQIIDKANENTSKKITDVQNSKRIIFKEFEKILEDITESYRKEMTNISEHLSDCINYIKKQGSIKRNLR